jgi:putative oxidoreductase
MSLIFLLGRVLFSAIFLNSGIAHLTKLNAMAQYAGSMHVPEPKIATSVTGVMILLGGLSILLGIYVPLGSLLLVAFLVPVAILMHPFWKMTDPMMAAVQQAQFMKNIALAGAALMIFYFCTLHPEPWAYSLGR